jgi:predicted PurR-regulated permease PerM
MNDSKAIGAIVAIILIFSAVVYLFFPTFVEKFSMISKQITEDTQTIREGLQSTASFTFNGFNVLNELAREYPIVMLFVGILLKEIFDSFKNREKKKSQFRFSSTL